MKSFKREFVFPKDIQIITGKGARYSRTTYGKVREYFNKEEHQLVTIDELAKYLGIDQNTLRVLLP